jgi:predicted regulator of Ras-like GTPase activity (Roadblock/LC7/MglB family)
MNDNYMSELLTELNQSSADIEGSLLCTSDGAPVASMLNLSNGPERLSAISSALLALAEQSMQLLDNGALEQLLIKAENGYLLLTPAGKNAVLVIKLRSGTKTGLIMLDARRIAESLTSL